MDSGAEFVGKDGWKAFKKTLKTLPGLEVVVGIPGEVDFGAPNVAAIGFVHEFGSDDGHVPMRSFIRSTFDTNEKKYQALMEDAIARALKAGIFKESALFVIGEVARADVIDAIMSKKIVQELEEATINAPIAPGSATLRGEGPALIRTGHLVDSIESTLRRR